MNRKCVACRVNGMRDYRTILGDLRGNPAHVQGYCFMVWR